MPRIDTAEHQRLLDSEARIADWKQWGPYVAERAWGTVREDYSPGGDAWDYFPHDHARSRAYRWNEDGLAGFCNRYQNLCMGLALWNEQDVMLKERLFGLTGPQGNHGEDVKEYYYYLDSTPTHSYAKMLYKYPQVAYPYQDLIDVNRNRGLSEPEYELMDALDQAFHQNRYFDVFVEYAKADQEDILCRITAVNRGPDPAPLHILPQLWFRNDWSWGYGRERPSLRAVHSTQDELLTVFTAHRHLAERWWYIDMNGQAEPVRLLFTENETNTERVFGQPNKGIYVKDGFHEAIVHGHMDRVNPSGSGSKAAAHFRAVLQPGRSMSVRVRLSDRAIDDPFRAFDTVYENRIAEADAYYTSIQPPNLTDDERNVQRQAFAGLMWSKQLYHYSVELWLDGDPASPPPPPERKHGRNADWEHLYNMDVLSMPDKWEYPWYAVWDLAFHMLPTALIDPEWAKRQLLVVLREWYMHPNGQIPAYEWNFNDVNPPVHAWAVWRVYKIARNRSGYADTEFLEKAFHKLMLNFTWWVNRKDEDGHNIFQGGFLGMDNIGVFDRSQPLPHGGHLEQADSTAWMAMYCLNMLAIALELARVKPAYADVASKFFEHFVHIARAINGRRGETGLWDPVDNFYYDSIHHPGGERTPLKIRSFVGLVPLFAVETLNFKTLRELPGFQRRMDWFLKYRPEWIHNLNLMIEPGASGDCLLSLTDRDQLTHILARMLDSKQFLSPYGLRSLSKEHEHNPYTLLIDGKPSTVRYEPAESSSYMFGGNSNWRGPIWFPVNFLMIESLQKYHYYYGDTLKVEMPTGSGNFVTLDKVAAELSRRLTEIFLADKNGHRAVHGGNEYFQTNPHWRDHIPFYEYFHGDNGAGIGASHQTGWTALVAKLIQQQGLR